MAEEQCETASRPGQAGVGFPTASYLGRLVKSTPENPVVELGYTVGSGAYAVADPNISVRLSDFGFFEYSSSVRQILLSSPTAKAVCAMGSGNPSETTVAAAQFGHLNRVRHHATIGYYTQLLAGHVRVGDFRVNGSSGGFTTWLLVEMLNKGLIDGVIHVKANPKGSSLLFDYGVSRTPEEVIAGAKSRYYPVEFSRVLNDIVETDGRFALVGIPSHIYEARLLSLSSAEVRSRIRYTVGLICGHQKSTKYAECIGWQFGIEPGDLESIEFRKKVLGRTADQYVMELTGRVKGEPVTLTVTQSETFVADWGHGFFKAKFSDYSDDALNETADVAVGDAWLPQYTRDSLGNNVVIVRHPDIAALVTEGIGNGALALVEIDEDTLVDSQAALVRHMRDELPYRLYLSDRHGEWRPARRTMAAHDLPLLRKCVQRLRMRISEQSHIQYRRAVEVGDWGYFERAMRPYLGLYTLVYRLIGLSALGWRGILVKVLSRFRAT